MCIFLEYLLYQTKFLDPRYVQPVQLAAITRLPRWHQRRQQISKSKAVVSSNSTMLTQLYETRHIIIGHRSSIRTLTTAHKSSRVFSVDTVTRLWVVTEVSGFDSRQGKQTFFYSILSRPVLGPKQPPTTRIKEVLYRGAKQPVRDAQCPSPCAANVTFKHNHTFTPPTPRQYAFLVCTQTTIPSEGSDEVMGRT
jgi:hypothetical protein